MSKVALCVDLAMLSEPALIGLPDENLAGQKWLALYTSAEDSRFSILADDELKEVWVAGCEQVDAINLAAAIKHDRPILRVCLLASDDGGSLLSRAYAASLDAVYNEEMFVQRYVAAKAALAYSTEGRLLESGTPDAGAAPQPSGIAGEPAATALPSQAKTALLITVVSASGGAGKSTVAALAALCLQIHGVKTVLVDFDYQFGNVAGFFKGVEPVSVDELLANEASVEKLRPTGVLPAIVSPPRNPAESELFAGRTSEILSVLSSRFDAIVANTGATWTEQHAAIFERSSNVLFLVDQRASSLQACHRALRLCENCGMPTGPFLFVANRCSKSSLLSSIDVSCALRGVETVELREGGRDVEDFSSAGIIADLVTSANPLYESLEGLLARLVPSLGESVAASVGTGDARGGKRGLFRRRAER